MAVITTWTIFAVIDVGDDLGRPDIHVNASSGYCFRVMSDARPIFPLDQQCTHKQNHVALNKTKLKFGHIHI